MTENGTDLKGDKLNLFACNSTCIQSMTLLALMALLWFIYSAGLASLIVVEGSLLRPLELVLNEEEEDNFDDEGMLNETEEKGLW